MNPRIQESGPFNLGQGENIKKITQDHGGRAGGEEKKEKKEQLRYEKQNRNQGVMKKQIDNNRYIFSLNAPYNTFRDSY